jgi:leucyl-tRNA synthetase
MAVPAHTSANWDFAKKFYLPIIQVVAASRGKGHAGRAAECTARNGVAVNSGSFDGMATADAIKAIHGMAG